MNTSYENDVVAWAYQQAALLRAGNLNEIDVLNIAEEIEDVAKSAQHELAGRLSVLLAHLLKWKFQQHLRANSWRRTIRAQRRCIARCLRSAPSLKSFLASATWLAGVWSDATQQAEQQTKLIFPDAWIWSFNQVVDPGFYPD
jgi:ribosomal protein L29